MGHKHIHVEGHGLQLGLRGQRLLVRGEDKENREYALNRVRTVTVHGPAANISGALLIACANRGIRLVVLGRGGNHAAWLAGTQQHAVVAVRRAQFEAIGDKNRAEAICRQIVYGKVRNQRAVLLYFAKYLRGKGASEAQILSNASKELQRLAERARKGRLPKGDDWRKYLLGLEGQSARSYWGTLAATQLLGSEFPGRITRGARDTFNAALNYGYAILASRVWNALSNAGLEIHAGVFHQDRPGKPSLVLDLMEEFRPWVVDRTVIKLRQKLSRHDSLDARIRRRLAGEIGESISRRHLWRQRRLSLESILQRQAYRMAGTFAGEKHYRAYTFRW